MSDNRDRLHRLRVTIDRAAQCYYYGTALLTDDQFDALLGQLRAICPDDERLTRTGYPVPPDSMLAKFKHTTFCGSLSKCDDAADLAKWHKKVGNGALISALKADGNSLVLYYQEGRLVRAVTRGGDDGVGEDVTANAIRSRGVPTLLPRPLTCAVRGESILPIESWLQVDPDQDSNPRNLGSGMLRRTEGGGAELLDFLAFDIDPQCEMHNPDTFPEHAFTTEDRKLIFLRDLGFVVTPYQVCVGPDNILKQAISFYEKARTDRDGLPYWIDGIVFKVNNLTIQRELGYQHGRPRAQTVLKFPAEVATTILERVDWQMGHTGALVPVGKLKPVRIGGVTVSSVFLNNMDIIDALNIEIGSVVTIIRAKDVIPQVTGAQSRYKCSLCGVVGTMVEHRACHGWDNV